MAGAQALGEFVSLDAGESFAIEYWPLELYKLAQAPPPGELQGQVALVTGGAGGIGRAIGDALAAAGACVVAFDLDQDGASEAVAALRRRRPGGQRRRHQRGGGGGGVRGRGRALRRRRHRRLQRRRRVERGARGDHAGRVAAQPRILVTGYFLVAREAFRVLRRRAAAARSCSWRPRTRWWRARTPPPTRRPRRPSCTSRAASPRRAAAPGSASTPSTPTPSSRARGSGARRGARSARRPTGSSPTSSRSTTASAPRSASTSSPRTSPRRCCTSPPPRARARARSRCWR